MAANIVYALVFLAVLAVLWVVWIMADEAGLAEGEKRDFENNIRSDGRQKTPLERFVSPGRLFRLQLAFALFPAFFVPVCFLVGGLVQPALLLGFGIVCGFAGWHVPRLYFNFLVGRRQRDFECSILDLTSGVANALKAGMAFPQALERIAARTTGAMKEELAIVLREYRLGLDMAEALERLAERMPCEDVRLFVASVRLTTKTGGSLADVLSEMAEMIRGRREFSEKVKNLTAQGKFEGYVLGAMPVVAFGIFYCIQPELMSVLFKTAAGWAAIGAAIVLETIGYFVISRIVTIEV